MGMGTQRGHSVIRRSKHVITREQQAKYPDNLLLVAKKEEGIEKCRVGFDHSLARYIFSITSLAWISSTTIALNFNRSRWLKSLLIASEYLLSA